MIRQPLRTKFPERPKALRKKKHKAVEIVGNCDQCGKPLAVVRARTNGSMVCAAGDRVPIRYEVRLGKNYYFYFCSEKCASDSGHSLPPGVRA